MRRRKLRARRRRICAVIAAGVIVGIAWCVISSDGSASPKEQPTATLVQFSAAPVLPTPAPTEQSPLWSEEDLRDMTLTLAGECYDDKETDKRLVCEVILNRVCAGTFGDTIHEVVSAPHQFNGYWSQSREVSASDIRIAEQALTDWYENGCEPLSEYLYFTAGENRENSFRSEY